MRQAFHRHDLCAVAFHGQHHAAVHRLAVPQDRARAALARRAAVLGAGLRQRLAQHRSRVILGGNVQCVSLAVNGKVHKMRHRSSFGGSINGRRASTSSMARPGQVAHHQPGDSAAAAHIVNRPDRRSSPAVAASAIRGFVACLAPAAPRRPAPAAASARPRPARCGSGQTDAAPASGQPKTPTPTIARSPIALRPSLIVYADRACGRRGSARASTMSPGCQLGLARALEKRAQRQARSPATPCTITGRIQHSRPPDACRRPARRCRCCRQWWRGCATDNWPTVAHASASTG